MDKKRLTTVRFDGPQYAELELAAKDRGMSVSALVRTCVEEFLRSEGRAAELIEFEARMAASLERFGKGVNQANNDVQLLIAIVDQACQFLFFATPEVVDKSSAQIVGNRRYKEFVEALKNSFSTRNKKSEFSTKLNEQPN
ncbi:hypothetical protein [Limnobacter sp. MED105]|uniref:hypothetical protein n=1 Tax=Limnobacter sp. MED105 TaxID=391597 RepID=UPI000156C592|nr:hypothetical protein [Limnobacter sp. MED105]EDM82099.1 hypothetical protein LMED105_00090 [Limnobacter sp. MED105]